MPNRILREGILTSERVNALGWEAEVFYRRLMSVVDDFGRFTAHPSLLRAALFPLKLDTVRDANMERLLALVEQARLVRVYEVAGKRYLELVDFKQQVRAKDSKYPSPGGACVADAQHVTSTSTAHAPVFGDGDVSEDGGEAAAPPPPSKPDRKKSKTSLPPGFVVSDRVKAWASENGHGQLPQHLEAFRLKATAAGYTYADWDAAFMTAVREDWAKLKTAPRFAAPGTTVADNPQVAETRARLDAEARRDLTVGPERIAAARALSAAMKGSIQ
jgi:hypothetical protein